MRGRTRRNSLRENPMIAGNHWGESASRGNPQRGNPCRSNDMYGEEVWKTEGAAVIDVMDAMNHLYEATHKLMIEDGREVKKRAGVTNVNRLKKITELMKKIGMSASWGKYVKHATK